MGHHSLDEPLLDVGSDSAANLDRVWEQGYRCHADQRLPAGATAAGCPARDVSGCQPRSAIAARGYLSRTCAAVPERVSSLGRLGFFEPCALMSSCK